jgi:quercetin dioxygenase-like cupin family protein
MQIKQLKNFTKGWLVGDFDPSIIKTKDFEVAVKQYEQGDKEKKHVHKIAREITAVVSGKFVMNGTELKEGDVVDLPPGEPADFEALEKGATVVIKTPSVMNDKYLVD